MPDRVVSSSKLTAIANAIRTKAGTQNSMTLDQMPTAIANIPSGGGDIDLTGYDGQNWRCAVAPSVDTSGMTDMSNMFYWNRNATTIDLSNFDTSNVTKMNYMFYNCVDLTYLDFGSFDTSNVTEMSSMLAACQQLTTIDNLSHIVTSNVTKMDSMFQMLASSSSPVSLDLSTFRTSNVTKMDSMFRSANLQMLDLDNWNTSNVTNMQNMFNNAFKNGTAMWVPSTFVATSVSTDSNKPFYADPGAQVHVYTNATSANAQGWGTIHANYIMHYNTTHQEFLNIPTVTIVIPDSIEHSGGALVQKGSPMTAVTLSPKATYRINQPSGGSGITVTASGNDFIISGTPTADVTINCTTTQNPDLLTSTQKNFANWTPYGSGTYYRGFEISYGVSRSSIPWLIRTASSGTACEGYTYVISDFPYDTPLQFSLTYCVEPSGTSSKEGCIIGISSNYVNGYIRSKMFCSISISGTQTEYITQTVNFTRSPVSGEGAFLAIVNTNYTKPSGSYGGTIKVQQMSLREI